MKAKKYNKLEEYIAPIAEIVDRTRNVLSDKRAVDAIANHYDEVAKSKGILISRKIQLPETLIIKESDMCAVMGNLIENAIQGTDALTGDDRLVNARIGILHEETLVIYIENPYRGTLTLDKDGLPISSKPDHGIGLKSVKNIVESYNGSMEIETHNQFFKVSILMYKPDD